MAHHKSGLCWEYSRYSNTLNRNGFFILLSSYASFYPLLLRPRADRLPTPYCAFSCPDSSSSWWCGTRLPVLLEPFMAHLSLSRVSLLFSKYKFGIYTINNSHFTYSRQRGHVHMATHASTWLIRRRTALSVREVNLSK